MCVVFLAVCGTACNGWYWRSELLHYGAHNHCRHLCRLGSYQGALRLLLCCSGRQVISVILATWNSSQLQLQLVFYLIIYAYIIY